MVVGPPLVAPAQRGAGACATAMLSTLRGGSAPTTVDVNAQLLNGFNVLLVLAVSAAPLLSADLAAAPGGLAELRQGMRTALRLRCQFWDHLLRTADGAQEQQA